MHIIESTIDDLMEEMRNCEEVLPSSESIEQYLLSIFNHFYALMIEKFLSREPSAEFGKISVHAFYERKLIIMDTEIMVRIMRIKTSDGSTHAVLPSFMIPYHALPDQDYLDIEEGNTIKSGNVFHSSQRSAMKRKIKAFMKRWNISCPKLSMITAEFLRKKRIRLMQFSHINCFTI